MKRCVVAMVGMIWAAVATAAEPVEVLAGLDVSKKPAHPVTWRSPQGGVVLHGDLFGDGRHLALVAADRTYLAVLEDGKWRLVATHETKPAWVPLGENPAEFGFTHTAPPATPFTMKDLDGDRVPEVLVAFANDGDALGYAIARKEGAGLKFFDLRSERGEPEFVDGMLEVVTETSGRKAWWSGTTYCRWKNGVPVALATWLDDARDPELPRWVAVRHRGDGKSRAFQIGFDGADWVVREGRWKDGVEIAGVVPFAKVRFGQAGERDGKTFLTELLVMFELTTGVPSSLRVLPEGNRDGFDYVESSAKLTYEVAGGDDAKTLFKRVVAEP